MTYLRTSAFQLFVLSLAFLWGTSDSNAAERPNVIVIFCDDLGYGDLGCFGHPTIHTPELDRMASEGIKWTNFYAASSVCTPSRAGLITGRLPVRSGLYGDRRRVLFPDSVGGLPSSEVTLAEVLQKDGYRTACIGKWHLGHLPKYLPTRHGFDYYFGIPYSNDMDRTPDSPKGRLAFQNPKSEYFNVPLMKNEEVIERPAQQETLTTRYTDETLAFIEESGDEPFFVYLAHSLPHVPLFRNKQFEGKSRRGLYGDVIEEIDHGVGRILAHLRETGRDENTLVVFTSDNGPWLIFDEQGGSAGPLRDGKGCTWEGGMREPTLMWWPSKIRGGQTTMELGSTLDLFATILSVTGTASPESATDSFDLSPVFLSGEKSLRDRFFFYRGSELMAIRYRDWKLHFFTQDAYGPSSRQRQAQSPPLLYHLGIDVGEKWDVAAEHPDVVSDILDIKRQHQSELEIAPSVLD